MKMYGDGGNDAYSTIINGAYGSLSKSDYSLLGPSHTCVITNSQHAQIIGGYLNRIDNSIMATMLSSWESSISNCWYGYIIGGVSNKVTATNGYTMGSYAHAAHVGSMVFNAANASDNSVFSSTATNQISIKASGGLNIAITGADVIVDSVWHMPVVRIVTNADVFLLTSHASLPSKLWDIGSNVWYVANGLNSTNWHREDGTTGL